MVVGYPNPPTEASLRNNGCHSLAVLSTCTECRTVCFLRYSDACVISGKPLVSAAAVGTDGQLTVYNYKQDGTTCFGNCRAAHGGEAGVGKHQSKGTIGVAI